MEFVMHSQRDTIRDPDALKSFQRPVFRHYRDRNADFVTFFHKSWG